MTEEEEKKTQENKKKKAPCLGFAGGDSAPADLNSPSDSTLAGRVPCALLYLSFLPCKASKRANVLAQAFKILQQPQQSNAVTEM